MKKFILLLMLTALLAQGASAQLTPESVIAGCPALPSVTDLMDLTGYGNSENENYNQFQKRLGEYRKSCSDAYERSQLAAKAKADAAVSAQVKDQTGRSMEAWQGMSKEEMEREGAAVADRKLKSMGIDKTVSQIDKMSDAEREAVGKQMASMLSGLTPGEITKISNMSDEEAIAYLQSTGGLERMMGKAFANMPAADNSEEAGKRAARMEELHTFIYDHQEKLRVEREQWREKEVAIHADAQKIWNEKYRPTVIELEKQRAAAIEATNDDWEIMGAVAVFDRKIGEQHRLFYTEVIPMWRNHVLARMEYEKSNIPEARKYDEAQKELTKMMRSKAEIAMSELVNSAMACAFSYLEAAESLHDFPTAGPGLVQTADGKD